MDRGHDLRTGPVFTTGNSVQSFDANNQPQAQFWSVSINDISAPPSLPGGGVSTKVGTLSLNTVGVLSGSWGLVLSFPETGFPDLHDPNGAALPLRIRDGIVTVVPEPRAALAVAGVTLLGFALIQRFSCGNSRDPARR